MSYELGSIRMVTGRYPIGAWRRRRKARRVVYRRPIANMLRLAVPAASTVARVGPQLPTTYSSPEGLGFSLKPSRKLRKIGRAIKKNITLKRALIAGAVVGGAFVAGPAMLKAARWAVTKGLPAGFRKGAGVLSQNAAAIVRQAAPPDGLPDPGSEPGFQAFAPQGAFSERVAVATQQAADRADFDDESDPHDMELSTQNGEPVIEALDTEPLTIEGLGATPQEGLAMLGPLTIGAIVLVTILGLAGGVGRRRK